MKNCSYCGRENDHDAVYCSGCGTEFWLQPVPVEQTAVETPIDLCPGFRSRPSLFLWPFLLLMVVAGFAVLFRQFLVGLVRISLLIAWLCYPVFLLFWFVLTWKKSAHAKEKAKFWLWLPWKIIGCCLVAVPILPMDEELRNFLGFTLGPAFVVALIMLGSYLLRRRALRWHWISIGAGASAFVSLCVYAFGSVLEMPYAYAFSIPYVKRATSPSGVPVAKLIDFGRYHCTIDGYSADWCGDNPNLIVVMLRDMSESNSLYFCVYDSRQHELVPLTRSTAERFPGLMPAGDSLIGIRILTGEFGDSQVGSEKIVVPEKWYRAANKADR